MTEKKRFKLAVLSSVPPMPYRAAFFRHLAAHQDIDLTVYHVTAAYAKKEVRDRGFGIPIKWGTSLLAGYHHQTLKSLIPAERPFHIRGQLTLGIIPELIKKRYDAIIIYGYTYLSSFLAFLGAKISKTPILFRGDSTTLFPRPLLLRAVKKLFLNFIFKRARGFLAIGSKNSDFYRYYGGEEEKIFISPLAVDNEFFTSCFERYKKEKTKLRQELNLPRDKVIVLFSGKLIERKRPFDLVRAFERASARNKAALLFAGDGKEREQLKHYATRQKIPGVYFAGFINQRELPKYYSTSDIFVLPSRKEKWGLVVNEAMNFDLPVIVSNTVGAGYDLVKPGENGFIFPAGDIAALSRFLDQLIKNDKLRERMGRRSKEIINGFGFDEAISGVISALNYLHRRKEG